MVPLKGGNISLMWSNILIYGDKVRAPVPPMVKERVLYHLWTKPSSVATRYRRQSLLLKLSAIPHVPREMTGSACRRAWPAAAAEPAAAEAAAAEAAGREGTALSCIRSW